MLKLVIRGRNMVNALILAGDRGKDGQPKALLKIKSTYMIEYVIKALRESQIVSKIYVAGDEILKENIGHLIDGFIKSNGTIMDNIRNSIKQINDYNTPLLICTSDIPMISGEAVLDFVKRCKEKILMLGIL